MKLQFWVKVYKANNAFYKDGRNVQIYCNHTPLGEYGINTVGEITPLPGASEIELGSPPSPAYVPAAGTPAGTIYPSPTQFSDSGFKAVIKIKDEVTLTEYYADAASYLQNRVNCNPASSCDAPYAFHIISVGSTGATISYTTSLLAQASEWIVNTSLTPPSTSGTSIAGAGTKTAVLTGLTTGTTYRFWARVICPGGVPSEWSSVVFTTS